MRTSRIVAAGVTAALVGTLGAGVPAASATNPATRHDARATAVKVGVGAGAAMLPVVRERRSATRAPAPASSFTIAVLPDTQQEVFGSDPRMRQRSDWLVAQRERLDLRFATHVGDVVNWGWLAPSQYQVASEGMQPLEQAGVPYSLSIGNHDTRAVGWDGRGGYGGGAYVQNPECQRRLGSAACKTELLVRGTQEFNDVFTAARFGAVAGAFEAGKVDNTYSTFAADGYDWLVLNLELWPRAAAVSWAQRVVSSHPRHNVVIVTHSYLNANGSIGGSAAYGATSPKYLWKNLVSRYPNVKLVLSGHVGSARARVDRGRAGNKIVSLLQTFHSNDANPVRLIRITPAGGSFRTWITSPNGRGGSFSRFDKTVRGMRFVR